MGSLSGGLFAQANTRTLFFARTVEKAKEGIENAVGQARSDVLREFLEPYAYSDLEKELPDTDWVFEGLGENMDLKTEYYAILDKHRKPGSIISTVSSGLSIEAMAEGQSDDFKAHFMGTHFYNPPSKLTANELIFHPTNAQELRDFVANYCDKTLGRTNIETLNVAAFAGNRIGFQLLNEAAILASKHGVEKIDYLIGPYTGRALPPLATIDLVGLDVHKAIVENVYDKVSDERKESYKMPDYMQKMMDNGQYGSKTRDKGGFYKRTADKKKFALNPATLEYIELQKTKVEFVEEIKAYFADGKYANAIEILKNAKGEDANIVRHFILGYVSYSFHRIGEVTPENDGIDGIDRVMSSGFSWLPASGWIDLFGGPKATIALIEAAKLPVPASLKALPEEKICKINEVTRFLNGR